jgi:hypothetical protein
MAMLGMSLNALQEDANTVRTVRGRHGSHVSPSQSGMRARTRATNERLPSVSERCPEGWACPLLLGQLSAGRNVRHPWSGPFSPGSRTLRTLRTLRTTTSPSRGREECGKGAIQ